MGLAPVNQRLASLRGGLGPSIDSRRETDRVRSTEKSPNCGNYLRFKLD